MRAQGVCVTIFYVIIHITLNIVTFNLLLAIMMMSYEKSRVHNQKKIIFLAYEELQFEKNDQLYMEDCCDIVLGPLSNHIKYKILKLKETKLQRELHQSLQVLINSEKQSKKNKIFLEKKSLGLFYLESEFRRFCISLAVEKFVFIQFLMHHKRSFKNDKAQLEYISKQKKRNDNLHFERLSGFMIILSCILLPLENPVTDPCNKILCPTRITSLLIKAFFLVEVSIRIIARGLINNSCEYIMPYL